MKDEDGPFILHPSSFILSSFAGRAMGDDYSVCAAAGPVRGRPWSPAARNIAKA
jgi:hypothetical protein